MTSISKQDELTAAVVSGNYSDIARVMGEMNMENAARICCHDFIREADDKDGWPGGYVCRLCRKRTPEVFCRTPRKCVEGGRCMSEVCCND